MILTAIRHTSVDVPSGICYGISDVPLADSFPEEAAQIQAQLNGWQFDRIYSSPLKRCTQLASVLFQEEKITMDDRLRELDFGDWEMQSWNDIPRGLVDVWAEDHVRHVPPNGESFLQLSQRAQAFIAELQHDDQPALVFTHAGVIRALTGYALELPLVHTFKLQVDYASVSKIILDDRVTKVAYVNR